MRNNASLVYSVALVIGDSIALLAAFTVAYILRVSLSHTPISEHVRALTYVSIVVTLLPLFLIVFALFGLYDSRVQWRRFRELGRLALGCLIGIMGVISYGYLANINIFPARLVTLYGFLLAFCFVLLFRTMARGVRRLLFRYSLGVSHVLLVGDTKLTLELITMLADTAATGYQVMGVVGCQKFQATRSIACFETFEAAVEALDDTFDTVVQTELYAEENKNEHILVFAQEHHLDYRFVPGNSELFAGSIEADLFQSVPVISVNQTALTGWGRVVKRLSDMLLGSVGLVVVSPLMLVVAVLIKLEDGGPVFFRQVRLTRGNREFRVFKFRTNYMAYNGLPAEDAFAKMGRPELALQYRKNGNQLRNDPRVTRVGHIIRRLSIDELPQLLNVLAGDISLVGPRALVTADLSQYAKRHTILSVKSGITGLAQVSGRNDISLEERRLLDIYYVQHWTFWGDLVILVKTGWMMLTKRNAL